MFYALDCGKLEYCKDRFYTLVSSPVPTKPIDRFGKSRIRRNSAKQPYICPNRDIPVHPLNQISMGSFSIERANRTTPIDVSALKPHLELLLESHTSSDGSLESLV